MNAPLQFYIVMSVFGLLILGALSITFYVWIYKLWKSSRKTNYKYYVWNIEKKYLLGMIFDSEWKSGGDKYGVFWVLNDSKE